MQFDVGEYLALTLIYSFIVHAIVEISLRLWAIRNPAATIKFRALVLFLPPPMATIATILHSDGKRTLPLQTVGLFDSRGWLDLFGNGDFYLWTAFTMLATVGFITLLAQIALPTWREHSHADAQIAQDTSLFPHLQAAAASLAAVAPSVATISVIEEPYPIAQVRGLRHLSVYVSRSLINSLDIEESEAVLAHEIAHVTKGHIWLIWTTALARSVMFYNPLALLASNQISLAMERDSDQQAVAWTRKPLALASALLKAYRLTGSGWVGTKQIDRSLKATVPLAAWKSHARRAFVEDRVRRILGRSDQDEPHYLRLRLCLVTVSAAILAYLVK